MERGVRGLEDVSKFPDLVTSMLSRGIRLQDAEKIVGLNVIRVMRHVEEIAGKSGHIKVLEDQIKQLWSDDFRTWAQSKFPESTSGSDVSGMI
jgi:membrane dipeptidase